VYQINVYKLVKKMYLHTNDSCIPHSRMVLVDRALGCRSGVAPGQARAPVAVPDVRGATPPPLHHLQLRPGLPLPLPAGGAHVPHAPREH
jgi:hypothetical protein